MTRTLLQISDDLAALDQLLEEVDGDVTDERVEQAINEWFNELEPEADEKIDNYAALIRELRLRGEARKEEGDRLKTRAKTDEARADWLTGRLYGFFKRHGIRKKQTRRFTVSIRGHGGLAPLIIDLEPEEIPNEYKKITVEADNTKIREALKEAPLTWARLGERGEGMSIR